jgi:hypothetical protein
MTLGSQDPQVKEAWSSSVLPLTQIIRKRFERLQLKGKPVATRDAITTEEIAKFQAHLKAFPGLNPDKLQKQHTRHLLEYQDWLQKHCIQRQYIFQIRKCEESDCCAPCILPREKLAWLPDPLLDKTEEHYQPFQDAYGTPTSEDHRPSYVTKKKEKISQKATVSPDISLYLEEDVQVLQANSSVYTAQTARAVVQCVECAKPRLIYSKNRIGERQKTQIAEVISEYEYSCGSPLSPPDHPICGKLFVRLGITCESLLELAYYASNIGRTDLCCYCANENAQIDLDLKKSFKTVLPLCEECKQEGKKPVCCRPVVK